MTTPNSQNTSSKSGGNIALIIILAVLVILMTAGAGFLGFMYLNNAKVLAETKADNERVEKEKLELDTQLQDLNEQFSKLMEFGNERIDSVVAIKDMEIASLRMQNRSGSGGSSSKVKAKVKELEALIADLLTQIDKLKQENADLRTANLKLDAELVSVNSEIQSLSVTNKDLSGKVDLAKKLNVSAPQIQTFFVAKNGKEKAEPKPKKVNKIQACFTLNKNDLAVKGERTVYIVVEDEFGKVINENSENVFMVDGKEMFYSNSKSIDYDGSEMNVCIPFSEQLKAYREGKYLIYVYIDSQEVSNTVFRL